MSLSAVVWLQFALQVFGGGMRSYHYIRSYVVTCITFPSFLAQATGCSKHHNQTVMDAGDERVPGSTVGYPSNSSAFLYLSVLFCILSIF